MSTIKIILLTILQFTWGIVMTTIGWIVALVLLILGYKPHLFYHNVYFVVGDNWGGLELGMIFLIDSNETLHTKQHESGHLIQNALYGIFFPFLVSIPSAIRYWVREQSTQYKKYKLAILISLCACLVLVIILITSICLNVIWLIILIGILLGYMIILQLWLYIIEIPRYKNNTPSYDSIWFEGQASTWGQKYFI